MNFNIIIGKVKNILKTLKICLCLIYLLLLNTLIFIRKLLSKIYSILINKNRKENLIKFINFVCLLFLIYNAIDMTIDFLQFDYEYKLIADYNKNGIDLQPISVCTETDVIFNKRKVISNFDIQIDIVKYEKDASNYYNRFPKKKKFPKINEECELKSDWIIFEWDKMKSFSKEKWLLNLCTNRFFQDYQRMIFDEMSLDELNALTFESNELFSCSAKVHLKNNITKESNNNIDNCFDKYSVKKTIKANKKFGVCYTFFDKNYQISIKTDDFIKISINFQKQKEFIKNKPLNYDYLGIYSKYYFRLFLFIDHSNKVKGNIIELNRSPSDITMNIITETNELLSTPYMDFCQQGEFENFIGKFY